MNNMMAPEPLAGSDILERILAAPGGLVVLDGGDSQVLIEQFRAIARHSGQSIYLWRPDEGMRNLRESHAQIPGSQRLGNALRYMQQSQHFGIYLLTDFPLPLSTMDNTLLRQLAKAPDGRVRRVVLLDAPPRLVAGLDEVAIRMSAAPRVALRPRLRDGRWLV